MAYIDRIVDLESDSVGDNEIIPGKADRKVRLYRLLLTFTAPVEMYFSDGPESPLSGPMSFGPGDELVLDQGSQPWYVTSLNQPLVINLSAECAVAGTAWFDYVPN